MGIDEHDGRVLRCRMLGHEVNFGYCRCGSGQMPCRKIFDCWFETFDVVDFINRHYSREDVERILAAPQPKITSIIEMIQQAQKNSGQTEGK